MKEGRFLLCVCACMCVCVCTLICTLHISFIPWVGILTMNSMYVSWVGHEDHQVLPSDVGHQMLEWEELYFEVPIFSLEALEFLRRFSVFLERWALCSLSDGRWLMVGMLRAGREFSFNIFPDVSRLLPAPVWARWFLSTHISRCSYCILLSFIYVSFSCISLWPPEGQGPCIIILLISLTFLFLYC